MCREELSRYKLGLIEEEEKKAKEGYGEGGGEDREKKMNGALDPEVRSGTIGVYSVARIRMFYVSS